jgi:hypothetical protein
VATRVSTVVADTGAAPVAAVASGKIAASLAYTRVWRIYINIKLQCQWLFFQMRLFQ